MLISAEYSTYETQCNMCNTETAANDHFATLLVGWQRHNAVFQFVENTENAYSNPALQDVSRPLWKSGRESSTPTQQSGINLMYTLHEGADKKVPTMSPGIASSYSLEQSLSFGAVLGGQSALQHSPTLHLRGMGLPHCTQRVCTRNTQDHPATRR